MNRRFFFFLGLSLAILAGTPQAVIAQEGHPLDGSWSGDRTVNGDKVRVLLTMKLLPDQTIEGMLIESGARIELYDIALDHTDWSVSFTVDGETRSAEAIQYAVKGVIENLGSVSDRWIAGTWHSGGDEGEFRVRMN